MRPATRLAWMPVALALIACGSSAARTTVDRPLKSGVEGRAVAGPTCPVQRVGQNCTRPYAGRLLFFSSPRRRLVRTVTAASDGRFSVRLRPGRYVIEAPRRLPRLTPTPVTVSPGRFTRIVLMFDTGIR